MHSGPVDILVALGANLGDREAHLAAACQSLAEWCEPGTFRCSRWIATRPVGGPPDQPAYLNAAARMKTRAGVEACLAHLAELERRLGRERRVTWEPRTLDLDLLLYGDLETRSPAGIVPHPRMTVRRFVLEPAAEIAAEWMHPARRRTIGQLLAHLDSRPNVAAVAAWPGACARQIAGLAAARGLVDARAARIAVADAGIRGTDDAISLERCESEGGPAKRRAQPTDATAARGNRPNAEDWTLYTVDADERWEWVHPLAKLVLVLAVGGELPAVGPPWLTSARTFPGPGLVAERLSMEDAAREVHAALAGSERLEPL